MGPVIQHASSSLAFQERLRAAVAETDGVTVLSSPEAFGGGEVGQIVASLASSRPDLVVVGPDGDLDTALLVAEVLDTEHPEISVVLVAEPSASVLERAMRAGTRGVLAPDAEEAEIRSVIDRAVAVAQRRRDLVSAPPADEPDSRIIPVLAAKGGSGKTTVATNLAAAIALNHPGDVLLVDLDMQFGDVASAFGVEPTHTFADVARNNAASDMARLKALLTPKQSASLYMLAAPDTPAEADDLDPKLVAHAIAQLATEFPYVVIDTAAGIDEFTLEALDIATDLVLLASMDVPSVRAVAKEIDALQMLGITRPDWHVVLNRASSKVGISVEDIETTLGIPIDVRIPSTRSIPLSVNRGMPITLAERRSPASRAFDELARRTAHEDTKTSRWARRK